MEKLLIIIPAHNEAASLPRVTEDLRRAAPPGEILIVDDASDDATAELLPGLGARWLRLPRRLGIGGALRAGLRWAEREGYEAAVRFDGDGQHLAREIERLLAPLAEADVVHGSRYLDPAAAGYRTAGVSRAGQKVLARVLSSLLRRHTTDPTSGFWAFGRCAIELLARHHPTGYPEPELLLLLHRNGLRVREVATEMAPRLAGRSTLTPDRTLVALARVVLALLIVPLRATVVAERASGAVVAERASGATVVAERASGATVAEP